MNFPGCKIFLFGLILVLLVIVFPNTAISAGFGIFTQDAAALGKANAQVAHAENPSAIFFNPALMNDLEGTQVTLGTTLLFPERKFTSDLDGRRHKTKSDVFYPSNFYLSHKANERFALGLGVFNPFGLGTDWGDTWEGRYLATKSEMETYNFNPAVSFQVTPGFSLAGGVNILFLDTSLERKLPLGLFVPGLPDGGQKFDGDGIGFGYNLGMLFDLTDDISIGLSYRSRIKVDTDGDMKFSLPDPSLVAMFPDTPASVDINLPAVAHAAVSYTGFERWTIEAGLRWEEWSSFKSLNLKLRKPVFDGQQFATEIREDKKWKNAYAFNLGAEYQLNDFVALRAGYLYGQTPVPDRTFEPSIPDADSHLFTLGTGISYSKFKFDLAYGYQKLENRKKDNQLGVAFGQPANGKYESEIHLIGMSIGYTF